MSKEIEIRQECCNIWNNLKDKTKIINYLIESKLQIADLETKLAESEHRNEQLVEALNGEVFINYKLPMENAQLKQQLAEYKTIKEKYKIIFLDRFVNAKVENARIWKEKYDQLKQQLAEKDAKIEELKKEIRDELVDNNMAILELQQSQNQTAIAELEKVKVIFSKNYKESNSLRELWDKFWKEFDQQIKSLKGEADGKTQNDN